MSSASSNMNELIAKHSNQLEQLRERLSDIDLQPYRKSDGYLIKWLLHSGFDLGKAETLLRSTLKWRAEQGMDKILNEKYSDIAKKLPYEYLGFDKAGRPVIFLGIGDWKLREVLEDRRRDDAWRHVLQYYETIDRSLENVFDSVQENAGHRELTLVVNQIILLVDAQNLSMQQMASTKSLKFMADFATAGEAHLPFGVFKLFCINASLVSRFLLKMISPFLSKATLSTLKFMGSNKEEWAKVLSKHIDHKVLPVAFGGSRVCAMID